MSVWFLAGNGGIDYGDYYWGLYRDYYRDPFQQPVPSYGLREKVIRGSPVCADTAGAQGSLRGPF